MGNVEEQKEGEVKSLTREEQLYQKYSPKYSDGLSVVTLIQKDGSHKICALRQFNRMEYSLYEETAAKMTNIESFELFLNTCWLEGDEEIKTNDKLFLQLYRRSFELLNYGDVVIKKN